MKDYFKDSSGRFFYSGALVIVVSKPNICEYFSVFCSAPESNKQSVFGRTRSEFLIQ